MDSNVLLTNVSHALATIVTHTFAIHCFKSIKVQSQSAFEEQSPSQHRELESLLFFMTVFLSQLVKDDPRRGWSTSPPKSRFSLSLFLFFSLSHKSLHKHTADDKRQILDFDYIAPNTSLQVVFR